MATGVTAGLATSPLGVTTGLARMTAVMAARLAATVMGGRVMGCRCVRPIQEATANLVHGLFHRVLIGTIYSSRHHSSTSGARTKPLQLTPCVSTTMRTSGH